MSQFDPVFFDLTELVCPHVYDKYHLQAWTFFDTRLLITIDSIRERIKKPIWINDWEVHGDIDQSGFRCIQCDIVKAAIKENRLYCSAHMRGQAVDFHINGMDAEEVRQYIIKNANLWPYGIRLERDVSWVHLDICNGTDQKVILFNP